MTKSELYDKIIEIYKKSGQGLPLWAIDHLNMRSEADELVRDGKLKVITHTYSSLPTDHWYCSTKGYCVEEDSLNKSFGINAYTCIRFYLKHDPVLELGDTKMSYADAAGDVKFMEGYNKWLKRNEIKLKEMEEL